jgi:cold shock CspA family protein
MAFGYISRLLINRGYGFILEDGQQDEIEFHRTALLSLDFDELREGRRVEFDRQPDHRDAGRFRAVNVKVLGDQD